jgi:hypothetical protein
VNGVLVSVGSLWPLTLIMGAMYAYCVLIFTSVACAIGPKCEHIEGSTDFSFQTQFLQFV